jgi:hypothetical protein
MVARFADRPLQGVYNARAHEASKGAAMIGSQSGTWLKPAAMALAIASLVLVCVNAALILRNESAQAVVNQRQQFLNQTVQVSRVALVLVQTIAKTAAATKDEALSQLLERHGVRLQPTQPPPGDGPPAGDAK